MALQVSIVASAPWVIFGNSEVNAWAEDVPDEMIVRWCCTAR